MTPFWTGFHKRAEDREDPYSDVFYKPDGDRPDTVTGGVKINQDLDAVDVSAGAPLMYDKGSDLTSAYSGLSG